MNAVHLSSRVKTEILPRILAIALVVIAFFAPIWTIKLTAPMYGSSWVTISVYANGIEGPIDQVNIINHYVGLAPINAEGIALLKYAPALFYTLVTLLAVSIFWRNRKFQMLVFAAFVLTILLVPAVTYYWLYTYGRGISPEAPIKIPPFNPPILGINRIANFVTVSYFDVAYWLIVVAAIVVALPRLMEKAHRGRRGKGEHAR